MFLRNGDMTRRDLKRNIGKEIKLDAPNDPYRMNLDEEGDQEVVDIDVNNQSKLQLDSEINVYEDNEEEE